MSKKTFFKRIAVTAIAALGFGMLSVAPSNATVSSHTLTIDAAADAIVVGDTATATLTHQFVNLGSAEDSVVLRAIVTSSNAASAGTIYLSVTDSYTSTANDASDANSPDYTYGGVTGQNDTAERDFRTAVYGAARESITISGDEANRNNGTVLQLKLHRPTSAGTYVISVFTQKSDAGAALVSDTPSVTWTVTVTEPTRTAAASSTVTLRQDDQSTTAPFGGTAEGTDSQTVMAATASALDVTPEFTLHTIQKSAISTNTAQESYTVVVTGQAYVTNNSQTTRPTANTGVKFLTMAHTSSSTVASEVFVWSTGTAGTATITLTSASGLTLGTKT